MNSHRFLRMNEKIFIFGPPKKRFDLLAIINATSFNRVIVIGLSGVVEKLDSIVFIGSV